MSMLMTSGAVLGGMVLGALLVRFQARRFAVKAVPGALNEAHMGFLFGGAARVSDVWWAQLVNGGHLERSGTRNRRGVLGWRRTKEGPADPFLKTVWEALPSNTCISWGHAHRYWEGLHQKVKQELRGQGLLPTQDHLAGRQLQGVVWLIALLGAALLSWAFLSPWVSAGLALTALMLIVAFRHPLDAFDTVAGQQQLKAWRQQHAASVRAPQASTVGVAVAIVGLGALAATPYAVHAKGEPQYGGSGSSDAGVFGVADGSFSAPSTTSSSFSSSASSDYATTGGFGGDSASTSSSSGCGSSGCGSSGCGGGGCGS